MRIMATLTAATVHTTIRTNLVQRISMTTVIFTMMRITHCTVVRIIIPRITTTPMITHTTIILVIILLKDMTTKLEMLIPMATFMTMSSQLQRRVPQSTPLYQPPHLNLHMLILILTPTDMAPIVTATPTKAII